MYTITIKQRVWVSNTQLSKVEKIFHAIATILTFNGRDFFVSATLLFTAVCLHGFWMFQTCVKRNYFVCDTNFVIYCGKKNDFYCGKWELFKSQPKWYANILSDQFQYDWSDSAKLEPSDRRFFPSERGFMLSRIETLNLKSRKAARAYSINGPLVYTTTPDEQKRWKVSWTCLLWIWGFPFWKQIFSCLRLLVCVLNPFGSNIFVFLVALSLSL